MVSKKTKISEVLTGLGILGFDSIEIALDSSQPPESLTNVSQSVWDELRLWKVENISPSLFRESFAQGRYFFAATPGLGGRRPLEVAWTGPLRISEQNRPPADLVVDQTISVSCKTDSKILRNPSPTSLFKSALRDASRGGDWYEEVAPLEYSLLLVAATRCLGIDGFPSRPSELTDGQRKTLKVALERHWPTQMAREVQAFITAVSERSSDLLKACLLTTEESTEFYLHVLRHSEEPYFLLGSQANQPLRIRVDSVKEFRQKYVVESFKVTPDTRGQPQIIWAAEIRSRYDLVSAKVMGHVEIRWSHGKFKQAPESKIYLDTPFHLVPGYTAF